MHKWNATPLKEVHGIHFGMSRKKVRETMGGTYREFKKSKFSKTFTDDFGLCHVFYNLNDECEAIEIFDGCEVSIDGVVVFPIGIEELQRRLSDLEVDADSYISKSQSIGIYAPNGRPESILFGEAGYYE